MGELEEEWGGVSAVTPKPGCLTGMSVMFHFLVKTKCEKELGRGEWLGKAGGEGKTGCLEEKRKKVLRSQSIRWIFSDQE